MDRSGEWGARKRDKGASSVPQASHSVLSRVRILWRWRKSVSCPTHPPPSLIVPFLPHIPRHCHFTLQMSLPWLVGCQGDSACSCSDQQGPSAEPLHPSVADDGVGWWWAQVLSITNPGLENGISTFTSTIVCSFDPSFVRDVTAVQRQGLVQVFTECSCFNL